MESFAEFVLFQTVFKRLVQLFSVKFVHFQKKAFHLLIVHFFKWQLSKDCQKLDLSDRIECIDEVLPRKIINGVNLPQILGAFFKQFLIQEIQTRVGVKLDIEIIRRRLVIFEQERLIILVDYEQIIQTYLLLCLHLSRQLSPNIINPQTSSQLETLHVNQLDSPNILMVFTSLNLQKYLVIQISSQNVNFEAICQLYIIYNQTITVMLPPYVNTLVFVILAASLIGCVGRFDYNLVLGLGWLYLGDKHPHFTNTIGFYVMIFGSVLIDGITIILSGSQPDRFTFLFVPLVEIIAKFLIAAVALQWQYARTKAHAGANESSKKNQQDIYNH